MIDASTTSAIRDRSELAFGVAGAVAVVGSAIHDTAEFGAPSPQNTVPVLVVSLALLAAWHWLPEKRRIWRMGFIAFSLVFLVGGALASVLPLAIWPWKPEQSVAHYAVHGVWALFLVPLLIVAMRADAASSLPGDTSGGLSSRAR